MASVCGNPEHKPDGTPFVIADGARTVTVTVAVNWGDDDLRADFAGSYTFCSFGCACAWLTEKTEHDGRTVVEGSAA